MNGEYQSPQRGMRKDRVPCIGELRNPIVFARSVRTPQENVGFLTTLTTYGRGWAKVEEGEVKWLGGVQCDPFAGFKFFTRNNDRLPVQINDVVLWGLRIFRVRHVKVLDPDVRRFCCITCREDVSLTSPDAITSPPAIEVKTSPPAQVEDAGKASRHNPYF